MTSTSTVIGTVIGTMSATEPAPTPTDFRFRERLRLRGSEADAREIVFNAHDLSCFDTAVAGYWRALAAPYAETMAALGGQLFVRKATLDHLASARYDEPLEVGVRCARVGRGSIVFEAMVFRRDQRLVGCQLVHVFADPATSTSRPVPEALRAALQAFEAGAPMVEVRLGSWDDIGAFAQALRLSVFVDEQKVPLELELEAADVEHLHAVAFNRFGQPLATGRLMQGAAGVGRIGRMATVASMRGGGIGRAVLDALVERARRRGDRELRLHAQLPARGFYRRAGFVEEGGIFDDAGIDHVEMVRLL